MNAAPKVCPCGCGSALERKRLVCARFWSGLPAVLRSRITSPASELQDRRAAIREALAIANKQRQATEQPLLDLTPSKPEPMVGLLITGLNYSSEKADEWLVKCRQGPDVSLWLPKGQAKQVKPDLLAVPRWLLRDKGPLLADAVTVKLSPV